MASTLTLALEAVDNVEGGVTNRRLVAAAALRMGEPLRMVCRRLVIDRAGEDTRYARAEVLTALQDAVDDFGREAVAATLAGE